MNDKKITELATNSVATIGHSSMITIPKKYIDKHNIKQFDKMRIYEKGKFLIMKKEE